MTRRYAREPGADQLAKWKAAIAAAKREQRQRRGRRSTADASFGVSGPGMLRVPTARSGERDGHRGELDGPTGD
jgi:hypothetical protein